MGPLMMQVFDMLMVKNSGNPNTGNIQNPDKLTTGVHWYNHSKSGQIVRTALCPLFTSLEIKW